MQRGGVANVSVQVVVQDVTDENSVEKPNAVIIDARWAAILRARMKV